MNVVSFADGPVVGRHLELQRAPELLRVTVTDAGGLDALDQLDDRPRGDERILVYRRSVGEPIRAHLNLGRRGCLWVSIIQYALVEPQPTDVEVRTTAAWRTWATLHRQAPTDSPAGGTSADGPLGSNRA